MLLMLRLLMKVRTGMSSDYLKKTFYKDSIQKAAVEAAVSNALAEDVDEVDTETEVRDKQVLIRVGETQRSQWQDAADADGLSVSEWLRQMADSRWKEIYTCTHPLQERKSYPWSEFCLKCGTRMR
jgi:hypothetical protein